MKKTLSAIAAAATLILASVASPQPAHAGKGGAVAAGVIGGLAVGAILGSALAQPHYGYAPGYAYAPGPAYYRPHCYWARERYWNGWRWHTHRVRVCR